MSHYHLNPKIAAKLHQLHVGEHTKHFLHEARDFILGPPSEESLYQLNSAEARRAVKILKQGRRLELSRNNLQFSTIGLAIGITFEANRWVMHHAQSNPILLAAECFLATSVFTSATLGVVLAETVLMDHSRQITAGIKILEEQINAGEIRIICSDKGNSCRIFNAGGRMHEAGICIKYSSEHSTSFLRLDDHSRRQLRALPRFSPSH